MLNKFGTSSREVGDEGNHTRIDLGVFEGEEAKLFTFAYEAAPGGDWYRHIWNPHKFSALALQLALRGVNVVEVTPNHAALAQDRAYSIELGAGNNYLCFDRRDTGNDDEAAWRRVPFKPSAVEPMRALIAGGSTGISSSQLTAHVKRLLTEAGVAVVPADPRWPQGNISLAAETEWRIAEPFSTVDAYTPPEPSREREMVVQIGVRVDGTPLMQGFAGNLADAVATLIGASDVGVHYTNLPADFAYLALTRFVPFETDESTGVVRLTAPSPWRIISNTMPKWGAA